MDPQTLNRTANHFSKTMNLHREISITEGQGPVPVLMTLDEIIKAGKVTNSYQTFVLGWLSEFFKNGCRSAALELESPISFESAATSTAVVNAIKSLSPENQVQLAQYLKDCIAAGESALHAKSMSIVDWMRYVLRRQD
jgi:hypothetical protein